MKQKIGLTLGLILLLFLAVSASSLIKPKGLFLEDVKNCNDVSKETRFSCYRAAMEKHFKGKPAEFSEILKNHDKLSFENTFAKDEDVTYAIFGTNCHSFYHAAGDFIASELPDSPVSEKLSYGINSCTSGYMMGLYKRTALIHNFSEDVLRSFFEDCGEMGTHQCAHEIGHVLHDKYTYSILKVLDDTSAKEYGLKPDRKYDYTFTNTYDLNAPFEDCRKIVPESEYNYCFTGIGHNLFLFGQFAPDGYKGIFDQCEEVTEENKKECFAFVVYRIGINDAATKVLSEKASEGIDACEEAIKLSGYEDTDTHCYVGIGGGIGLYADSEFAGIKITPSNEDKLKTRMNQLISFCEKLPTNEQNINNCIAGLFGTPFKKYYEKLEVNNPKAEEILKDINKNFIVVG